MTGEYGRAILLAGDELWNSNSTPRTRAELSLITAAAECLLGDTSRAAAELSRGVGIIEKNGLLRTLTTIPRDILEKLARQTPGLAALLDHPAVKGAREVIPADIELVTLTDREVQLLRELSSNRSMKEIAGSQFVSLDTVRSHHLSLYRKLGVHSRIDAVIRAREWGLL
ncbi:MAG TPA: LuxR C-terminal-related transcriptional regulator [Acidimicrobiales bacterium]|jgi:LuxR family maltose regulon positive regulatory protein